MVDIARSVTSTDGVARRLRSGDRCLYPTDREIDDRSNFD